MVVALAAETPGADVIKSARTAEMPLPILGRCIAGLAETITIRPLERDDLDHARSTVAPSPVPPQAECITFAWDGCCHAIASEAGPGRSTGSLGIVDCS